MATSSSSLPALVAPLVSKTNLDVDIPRIIYGTAWKKEQSSTLVQKALKAGFRGVDTAAQPRHYNEALVGDGISKAVSSEGIKREDLYIQTKFTSISGQDPKNMPYGASQPLEQQIHTSIASSLKNLTFQGSGEPYIDCLVLHSPLRTIEETLQAWKVFESYVPTKIRTLGISNTTLDILQDICAAATIKPSVVQNRFYPATQWDVPLRSFCRGEGIVFQTFWTLTGNPGLLKSKVVKEMAEALKSANIADEKAVALYSLVLGLEGTSVLNGTTNEERMAGDLDGLRAVGTMIEGEWKKQWEEWLEEFKGLIGEL
ncbi:Aldo/keto reductase [Stipitochalara longipes BDJ]|nr:Aldo/keto reductase [Stipitochalara longipes BDJ]